MPAATLLGELEPNGPRPGFDTGNPETSILKFDTSIKTGIWECEPGGWDVAPREDTEVCYILSGQATITDASTGRRFEISGGDVIVQPKDWSGRWEVTETIRKFYCHDFD
ncbi:cupin domain-containing protein [Paenarthrobacter sp. NPDC018779]|uniref:cupin domain-containing protein n=1 Tax=Paenarthrobacter sp. NPDC018779 TaxID=3364375 RepID=UPI0037CB71BF